jgi:hypothetical protein
LVALQQACQLVRWLHASHIQSSQQTIETIQKARRKHTPECEQVLGTESSSKSKYQNNNAILFSSGKGSLWEFNGDNLTSNMAYDLPTTPNKLTTKQASIHCNPSHPCSMNSEVQLCMLSKSLQPSLSVDCAPS